MNYAESPKRPTELLRAAALGFSTSHPPGPPRLPWLWSLAGRMSTSRPHRASTEMANRDRKGKETDRLVQPASVCRSMYILYAYRTYIAVGKNGVW